MKTLLLVAALSALPLAPAASAQTEAAPAAPAATPAAKYNLDTPIQDIVADPKAKAAFDAALPGVSNHESYDMFKGMSLNQLKAYAADKLTPEVLANVEKALAQVK